MSTRKYLSGYEKLLKKRKIEKQIESQKGFIYKYLIIKRPHLKFSPKAPELVEPALALLAVGTKLIYMQ